MSYSFKRKIEDIINLIKKRESADFGSAEMVNIFWETKPEIIKNLLPRPLKMPKVPLAFAFIANYPETNFGLPYRESALFIRAAFKNIEGNYCLAMHLDGPGKDVAMAGGREVYGFPKKQAKIHFNYKDDEFEGSSERLGTKNLEIKAKFTGKFNDADTLTFLMNSGIMGDGKSKYSSSYTFNFKFFPAPEGNGYDYQPRLVQQETVFRPKIIKIGEVQFKLGSSIHDPWAEIEVVRVLGAMFQTGNNSMNTGKVVAEVNTLSFQPYAYLKWDWYI